ncbi:aldehyde dehydrogenase [Rhodocyclus tenuis]|uniref:Aldehyde dehydrogenase n=1 Tax=Rhodocyclus gracilis TaxID=2929842 RepID=A0ABX0WF38_9RHOO|nr:aldehyde dehydrogenase family protein [Rhodocyclus gracilis]NJA88149.1 aldehyde dehydrogenase [Rhodocyclus gracilis]
MSGSQDTLVIPLWIDGHAYLTMTTQFCDVCHAVTGEVLRRTPLTGADEAQVAVSAAQRAQAGWRALGAAGRARVFAAAADGLTTYADHFAGLIIEENGFSPEAASAEVAASVAALAAAADASAEFAAGAGVLALVADRHSPLAAPLQRALVALQTGATVVIKPSPRAPSALYALAEVLGEAGLAGGVLNLVHGDDAAVVGLATAEGVQALVAVGQGDFATRVGALLAPHGKTLAA